MENNTFKSLIIIFKLVIIIFKLANSTFKSSNYTINMPYFISCWAHQAHETTFLE